MENNFSMGRCRQYHLVTVNLHSPYRKFTGYASKCFVRFLLLSLILIHTCRGKAEQRALAVWDQAQLQEGFEVIIAGGSTAAFAAALASAASGARTALLEPTDWVGGQLTASGVPAIDEAWHKIKDPATGEVALDVSRWARDPRNITPNFLRTLQGIEQCGECWVSRFCFTPREYLQKQLLPLEHAQKENLVVFRETVVKQVQLNAEGSRLDALLAVQRMPTRRSSHGGYERLPSAELADWYSPADSERFDKQLLHFRPSAARPVVFIDATEWGELLALSGLDYLQGVEKEDGGMTGEDTCGQSTVFCFVQKIHYTPQVEEAPPGNPEHLGFGDYRDRENAWQLIWTYRRIKGEGTPGPHDLCLQNWGYSGKSRDGGNDYPFGYLLKSKQETAQEFLDWQGGVNLQTMAAAEQRAFGWHHWFRHHAPPEIAPEQITLDGEQLGTRHGLAKLPYVRDTRRSIGLDRFVLKYSDLTGPASQKTGTVFPDRIALGAYPADVHPMSGCEFPAYIKQAHDTLPFYIPFRALTHYRIENMLVAGKTMAQSFLANSATRLHPIEWSSGTAAGVAAAYMARTHKTSRQSYDSIAELQQLIQEQTPIDWTSSTRE